MTVTPFMICILMIVALGTFGLPIGHAMIVASVAYMFLSGVDPGTAAEQILNGLFNSYVLLAIPLFILAADLMNIGSLTDRLLNFCLVLVGRFRGGLGHVNVVANMIFAGMSGSAIADAVGIGRIIIGMMAKDGRYPVAYAAAITAAAAVIGPIIPPSIPMVVYALVSDASIGYLFLGGFVPGVLLGLAFMATNFIIARKRNYPVEPPIPLRDVPKITINAFPALMLPVILLFGIYGGVMTPTEGAAVAAFYALLASALLYRSVTLPQLYTAILNSSKATTSIGMLIAGAMAFNYVVTIEQVPLSLQHFIGGFQLTAGGFMLLVNLILLVLGCLLEGTTILLVVVPILIPTAKALGIDLVHFGVVVVVNVMIGLVTPPYGLLLFVVANMTKQPLGKIVREALPFIVAALLVLAFISTVPGSVLWLPRVFGYKG
jgi:C4-dicarboxylate transporter DctM subunit